MNINFREFKKFLEGMDDDNMIVKKTIPVKKEWKVKHKELHDLGEEMIQKEGKLKALKNAFWAEVELSLNEFGDMRYNHETDEIEIMEEVKGKKPIKSPIQMM